MIELLAPAKDKNCAVAAINYGADAVYISAGEFSARKNASNSLEDIKYIVEYAHKFNVKVYITINTVLTDDEITRAKTLISNLAKIDVDAIIIQDMGLLEYIKSIPNITPHASTQCDNRSIEKVKFLESVGFKRAILARELSIEQIKEIRKNTKIELEAFIHGALCVSYSGQCYLSYAIGGRSANRGECAQPCRKKYSLVDGHGNFIAKNKYLLCLKDFNLSKHIKELADAGVTSFKIEGRLKDENYVKNVVAYYRKLIDELELKKTSSGKILFDFEPNLEKSFNRGFTDYFAQKRHNCYTFESPKSIGEYLGKITEVSKEYFKLDTFPLSMRERARDVRKINSQDGLCFFHKGELSGCLVNKIENWKIYPNKIEGIKIGTEIYRNFNAEFEKKLTNSKTCRKIGVNISFDLNKITALDEDQNLVEIVYNFEEFAQNKEKMGQNITTQFKKSGDTEFLMNDVNILTDKLPFLPVSKLNELRREVLNKLMQKRLENYKFNTINLPLERAGLNYPQSEIDYRGNVSNKTAREFYEKHGCKVTEAAFESGDKGKCHGRVVMKTKHCLKYAFNMCKSPEKLYLIDEKNKRYELKFDCDKCEMEIVF